MSCGNERFLCKGEGLLSNISICVAVGDSESIEGLVTGGALAKIWGEIIGDDGDWRRATWDMLIILGRSCFETRRGCSGGVVAVGSGPLPATVSCWLTGDDSDERLA